MATLRINTFQKLPYEYEYDTDDELAEDDHTGDVASNQVPGQGIVSRSPVYYCSNLQSSMIIHASIGHK